MTGRRSTGVGFMSQRRSSGFYSKCYGKPLKGCDVMRFVHLYILRRGLWLQRGEWIVKGQEEKGKQLRGHWNCLGEK